MVAADVACALVLAALPVLSPTGVLSPGWVAAPLGGLLGDAAGYQVALVLAAGVVVAAAVFMAKSALRGARIDDHHAVADTAPMYP